MTARGGSGGLAVEDQNVEMKKPVFHGLRVPTLGGSLAHSLFVRLADSRSTPNTRRENLVVPTVAKLT